MAILRQGSTVSQVGFVPASGLTMSRSDFVWLARRALERLPRLRLRTVVRGRGVPGAAMMAPGPPPPVSRLSALHRAPRAHRGRPALRRPPARHASPWRATSGGSPTRVRPGRDRPVRGQPRRRRGAGPPSGWPAIRTASCAPPRTRTGVGRPAPLGAIAGEAFHGDARRPAGGPRRRRPTATSRIRIRRPWPRRAFGGSSVFQSVPGSTSTGTPGCSAAGPRAPPCSSARTWDLNGATVYAEKNWGRGGFPESWWWGQAQGFADPSVCVAFAGGEVRAGPLRTEVTALVVLPARTGGCCGSATRLVSPVRAARSPTSTGPARAQAAVAASTSRAGRPRRRHVLPVPLPTERRNMRGSDRAPGRHDARLGAPTRPRGLVGTSPRSPRSSTAASAWRGPRPTGGAGRRTRPTPLRSADRPGTTYAPSRWARRGVRGGARCWVELRASRGSPASARRSRTGSCRP